MFHFILLLIGLGLAHAATTTQPDHRTPRAQTRASTCTPLAGGNGSIDDVPAIQSAIASCASGTIVIPTGTTYYINSAFSFAGCSGCAFQIEGTLKVASDTDYWGGRQAIFLMSGINGANIFSLTGSGVIDGNGQNAYDLFATDSTYKRPTLFYITNSKNVVIQNLRFKNAPNVFHSVTGGSTNIDYTDITLSAVSKSSNAPKNTDGWDIGTSTYVTITRAKVTNDDDCVAFKSGCNYATVTDITCVGSHGISVGSLGKTNTDTVQNVLVSDATMINSTKAAGIKLYPGGPNHGTAAVSNVTFQNVVVQNCDYAFQVQSCYGETASYCTSYPSTAQLSGLIAKGFSGTTSSKYAPTVANINCPAAGSCGLTMASMSVKPPSGSATYLCATTPDTLGVTCKSGASG
ncbi:glycoside hydrolase family 28 protein [Dactylonectria estremocensis]|uniref:Glycoside hydrolase family 28 protein n=1 Tax=Dactylonectria estremocensis TaxID=1079267 RepID=A0A9P9EGG6_9HYPO|nr:glycoside hydrolase family 28 protein [Dactylonectria estremocensis]